LDVLLFRKILRHMHMFDSGTRAEPSNLQHLSA
jgi:hypothetical protein